MLTIEVVPELVGVAEAAEILGWDKRRIFTYISRSSFPEPVAMLASGRVWRRDDIEEYARGRRSHRSG
jgi:predicted DNA-binding transcriptional regulator AlpA